jgi:hypothetical protein
MERLTGDADQPQTAEDANLDDLTPKLQPGG